MKQKKYLLLILTCFQVISFGVGKEKFLLNDVQASLSPNTLQREEWVVGSNEDLAYVKEVQIHLGKGSDQNTSEEGVPHFTILSDGKIIQHARLDQITRLLPKKGDKELLLEQYLIHVNITGREPTPAQIDGIHQLVNKIKNINPEFSIKWCVSEPSLLTIPWIKKENIYEYSDNLSFYKLFTLTQHSSEMSSIGGKPVYWVPSMNYYSRENSVPKILNLFRTGKSAEETSISYIDKNKKDSAHFTIDEAGRIFQHVLLKNSAYFVRPSYGPLEVGLNSSLNQIAVGLTGSLKDNISPAQEESLKDLVKFLKEKYGITSWTTPVKATKDSLELKQTLLPHLPKLNEVHLTQDSKLGGAKSLIYQYLSPNQSERSNGKVIDTIVLHHTRSSWSGLLINVSKREIGVSSHFTINQDGTIVQHVSIEKKSWHAGKSKDKRGIEDVNDFSIGIELVNTGDCEDPYTEEQVNALKGLLSDLKTILSKDLYQITTHEYVAQPEGRKCDPLGFPWEKLKEFEPYIVRNPDEKIIEMLIKKMQVK